MQTARLRVMLIISLSELMSDVQVTQMKSDGTLEESGEARRLRKSLEEMADEGKSANLLREGGLPESALLAIPEKMTENRWSWSEVKYLSDCLLLALDARLEHALLVSLTLVGSLLSWDGNLYIFVVVHLTLILLGWVWYFTSSSELIWEGIWLLSTWVFLFSIFTMDS